MSNYCCTAEIVDLRNPIMDGTAYWFHPLSRLTHSGKVYDIAKQNHAIINGNSNVWATRPSREGSVAQLTFTNNELVTAGDVLAMPENFTISAWVYSTSGKPSGNPTIVSRSVFGGSFEANYVLCQGSDDSWLFYFRDLGGSGANLSGGTVALNEWTHIVATCEIIDESDTDLQLYVNGSLVNSGGSVGSVPGISGSQSFNIGSYNNNVDNWHGGIDDVLIYDKVLSAPEVLNLYRESKAGYPAIIKDCCKKVYLLSSNSSGTTYNHTSTGGIVANSSAVVRATYGPTVSSGVLAASSATVVNLVNPTPSGAILAAGVSSVTCIYAPTITGGVLCSGQFIDSTGGVKCEGSATVTVKYAATASGGAVGNSSATVFVIYNTLSYWYDFTTGFNSGYQTYGTLQHEGVWANSSPAPAVTYSLTITGGVSCAGSATVLARYRPTVAAFGARMNSSAIYLVKFRPTISGGAILNSSAVLGKTFDTVATGGALVASSAVILFTYVPEISGSILANSSALETLSHLEIGSGGVACAGIAPVGYGYVYVPSGGALAASSASVRATYILITTGGVICAGLAVRSLTIPIISSGVIAAGIGTARAIFATTVSGGVLATGDALIFRLYSNINGSGGAILNSSAIMVKISEYITATPAGVLFGGSVTTNITAFSILTGRLLMSGLSDVGYIPSDEKLIMYHQFDIGEVAYFVLLSQGIYLKKRIRQIYLSGQTVFYETNEGELIAEDLLLSLADCRARSKGRVISPGKKTRKSSILNPLPSKFATSPGLIRRVR